MKELLYTPRRISLCRRKWGRGLLVQLIIKPVLRMFHKYTSLAEGNSQEISVGHAVGEVVVAKCQCTLLISSFVFFHQSEIRNQESESPQNPNPVIFFIQQIKSTFPPVTSTKFDPSSQFYYLTLAVHSQR